MERNRHLVRKRLVELIKFDPEDIQAENAITADQLARYQALNKLAGTTGVYSNLTPEQLKKREQIARFSGLQSVLSGFHDRYGKLE